MQTTIFTRIILGLSPWGLSTALMMAVLITGCQKNQAPQGVASEDTLEQVRRTKQLQVGYFLFEPTIVEDKQSGQPKGVFIDLIESIAKSLDAKVVYNKVDLANFAAGLQSHQFDLSIGATFATPQRATAVLFTRPIFYCGYTGVARKGVAARFQKWQDLDSKDLTIAVKQGSAIDDFVRDNFKSSKVIRLTGPDLTLPLAAVSAGQADVGLMNQLTVFTYLREHPELDEVLRSTPIAPTYFAWAVRPGDERWLRFLDTAIGYWCLAKIVVELASLTWPLEYQIYFRPAIQIFRDFLKKQEHDPATKSGKGIFEYSELSCAAAKQHVIVCDLTRTNLEWRLIFFGKAQWRWEMQVKPIKAPPGEGWEVGVRNPLTGSDGSVECIALRGGSRH